MFFWIVVVLGVVVTLKHETARRLLVPIPSRTMQILRYSTIYTILPRIIFTSTFSRRKDAFIYCDYHCGACGIRCAAAALLEYIVIIIAEYVRSIEQVNEVWKAWTDALCCFWIIIRVESSEPVTVPKGQTAAKAQTQWIRSTTWYWWYWQDLLSRELKRNRVARSEANKRWGLINDHGRVRRLRHQVWPCGTCSLPGRVNCIAFCRIIILVQWVKRRL
jgi:hypothetical protein